MPKLKTRPGDEPNSHRWLSWWDRGACRGFEDSFIFEKLDRKVREVHIPEAIATCKICPVYSECSAWAATIPNWSNVVVGGKFYGKSS